MSNLNKVMLMGRLTRDVEVRAIPSGLEVANFSLAINRVYYAGQGDEREKREEVTFVDCEMWGRRAAVLGKYVSKGDPLYVEGRLKLDTWEDKNGGGTRKKMSVNVEDFQFLGRSSGGSGASGDGRGTIETTRSQAAGVSADDIPF